MEEEKYVDLLQPGIKGKFNKDILLNTYFEHTDLFSPAAKQKIETGRYCGEPFNSKKYNIYWGEQRERCLHGYTNPVTKIHIPGLMYFFLNFKQLKIVKDTGQKVSKRTTSFPRFWPIHYFYLTDLDYATKEGYNTCVLKPRGTGWSELMSCLGVYYYTFQKEEPCYFFAAAEGYLNKSGLISKAWDQLTFLDSETERAFKHLRQKVDRSLWKVASYWSSEKGAEVRTGGEIIGKVIDKADKARGGRGYVFFEEGGSFPNLVKAWMICWALVEQGGTTFSNMMLWGTGGEQGPGIAGLEDIFMHPEPYKCLPWENCWEDTVQPNDHGFFFPVWALMDRFMDRWGNTDYEKAYIWHMEQREIKRKKSPHLYDKYIAEYPMTPGEALMRLSDNPFPVAQLQSQLRKVDNDPNIKGILKHGELMISEGDIKFKLHPNPKPIDEYPHQTDQNVDGCLTVFEAPLRDETNQPPANLYTVVADCFYVDTDQATDWNSLGAYFVYKHKNNLFPTEDDILVAWYAGRPNRVKDFYRNVFMTARYYNAKVQSEILGGGQGLLDYAKENGLIQYCGERSTIFSHDKELIKQSQRQFFVNISKENKKTYLQLLADWLLTERALKIEDDKTQYVINLDKIYDRALLQELIKFNPEGNFDRISCLLVLMATRQEAAMNTAIESVRVNKDHIYVRPLFTDGESRKSYMLSAKEIMQSMRQTGDSSDLII